MTYSANHMLLQWYGSFSKPEGPVMDQFVGSLRFAGPEVQEANNDEVGYNLLQVLGAFWKKPTNFISTFAILQGAKWNHIGTDGKYVARDRTRNLAAQAPTPGGGGTGYPLQICWTTTWLTAAQRGRASKGRTYWPTSVPVTAGDDCRVGGVRPSEFAYSCAQMIQDMNQVMKDAGVGARAAVMSNIGAGETNFITSTRVGNRLDIQRRRDNHMPERYSPGPVFVP